jgi:glycosyltransferase involved in cell wall biosynthesis
VIPSVVWETYSVVAREGMACGIPVIASRLGALPEAVRHGQNGLLFEPGSALDLATILQELDSDRERLTALRTGIQPSDWISVEERTDTLEALLGEVVADKRTPSAAVPEFEELSILRNALLEGSAAG